MTMQETLLFFYNMLFYTVEEKALRFQPVLHSDSKTVKYLDVIKPEYSFELWKILGQQRLENLLG